MKRLLYLFLFAAALTILSPAPLQATQVNHDGIIVCVAGQQIELPDRLHIKVFDTAINTGISRANKILQQAINDVYPAAGLKVDGVIGSKSRAALCGMSEAALLRAYADRQAAFYRGIVARKPSQQKYINGWLRRASWIPL